MMRTKQLCNFEKNISEINNVLSHTVFVFEQFSIDSKELVQKRPDDLTTTIYNDSKFSSNQYVTQFNVKLSEIDNQAKKSLDYIFDVLFVYINTHFEVYLKDVYLFVKDNTSILLKEPPDKRIYKEVLHRLKIDLKNEVDPLFVNTYEYFKLRRNSIMHRDKQKRLQGVMEKQIKDKGNELNRNWKQYKKSLDDEKQKGYSIQNFDFANRDISRFNLEDLIEVFNFYRLYSSTIDKLILQKIDRKDLLKYCAKKYKEIFKDNNDKSYEKFSIQMKRTNKFELNLELEEEEIKEIWRIAQLVEHSLGVDV